MKSFFDTYITYFLFNFINYIKLKFVGLNIESKFDKNVKNQSKLFFLLKFNTSLIHLMQKRMSNDKILRGCFS